MTGALSMPRVCLPDALPRFDFERLMREQLEAAHLLRKRILPPESLSERILSVIEGPWAPSPKDLPERRCPVALGNAREAFRTSPSSAEEQSARRRLLRKACGSEKSWRLSAWTSVFEYEVPVRELPSALSGFTILHLSDIHLLKGRERPLRELEHLATFVERSNRRFDAVLMTGDLITRSPDDLCSRGLSCLQRIAGATSLAFSVHGNHDYHGHVPALISRELERVGFYDLNNQTVTITVSGAPLTLIGVDDAYFGHPKAPESIKRSGTNIVLTHNLDSIRSNFPRDVDLILSGHTHWGEARMFDGARLMKMWGYSDNVNRHTKHWDVLSERTLSYVHPGLARYYVPYRGLCYPPGIAIHSLVPADS